MDGRMDGGEKGELPAEFPFYRHDPCLAKHWDMRLGTGEFSRIRVPLGVGWEHGETSSD